MSLDTGEEWGPGDRTESGEGRPTTRGFVEGLGNGISLKDLEGEGAVGKEVGWTGGDSCRRWPNHKTGEGKQTFPKHGKG